MKRVDVVSPQFPCGAAWLASALLGLGVRPSQLWGFDTADEWQSLGAGRHRYVAQHRPWRQTIAPLVPDRIYQLRDDYELRFTHAFPWQLAFADKVVVIVRDPRDALFSEWQRHRRNLQLDPAVTFTDFLQQPFFGGPVSIEAMLRLHMASWLACVEATGRQHLVLRFEDWKAEPVAALQGIAQWLRLDAPTPAIVTAAAAADVSHLQAIESQLVREEPTSRQFNRRGQANEWREVWQAGWDVALPASWRPIFVGYGYAPPNQPGAAEPDLDWRAFSGWRDLCNGYRAEIWRARIAGVLNT